MKKIINAGKSFIRGFKKEFVSKEAIADYLLGAGLMTAVLVCGGIANVILGVLF